MPCAPEPLPGNPAGRTPKTTHHMNTLNQTELAVVSGGEQPPPPWQPPVDQWAYDQLMRQLQQQAEEAERKAWQEFMASQAA